MITDKLTIFGDREDVTRICDLINKCAGTLEVKGNEVVAFVEDVPEQEGDSFGGSSLVIPFEVRDKVVSEGGIVTFSETENSADVSSLNLQQRTHNLCFEVLSGTFMSRVFIPNESNYTPRQVLVCVSILSAWNVDVDKIIPVINESLK